MKRTFSISTWIVVLLLSSIGPALAQTTPPVSPAPSDPAAAAAASQPPAAPESGPDQPIPFSHKIHAGTGGLPCETCHTASRSGESLTLPQAPVCMQCHQAIATTKPAIQKLSSYAKDGRPIPWVRVYEVPSFVSFSHKVHLEHGNTCVECHGAVAERTTISKETDISMAGCMGCHKAKNAASGCSTCHLLDQSRLRRPEFGTDAAGFPGPIRQGRGVQAATSPAGAGWGGDQGLRRFLTTLGGGSEVLPVSAHSAEVWLPGRGSLHLFSTLSDEHVLF